MFVEAKLLVERVLTYSGYVTSKNERCCERIQNPKQWAWE